MLRTYNGFDHYARMEAARVQEAAFRTGKVTRPTVCIACSQTAGEIIAHLEDYTRPLDAIIPVCFACHMMIHCRFRALPSWDGYRGMIRAGWQQVGIRAFGHVQTLLANGGWVPSSAVQVGPPRDRTVLDDIQDGKLLPAGVLVGSSEKPETKPTRQKTPATMRDARVAEPWFADLIPEL